MVLVLFSRVNDAISILSESALGNDHLLSFLIQVRSNLFSYHICKGDVSTVDKVCAQVVLRLRLADLLIVETMKTMRFLR